MQRVWATPGTVSTRSGAMSKGVRAYAGEVGKQVGLIAELCRTARGHHCNSEQDRHLLKSSVKWKNC